MEKKKYTKPTVMKVELTHEQAVLGTCSTGIVDIKDALSGGCSTGPSCKQRDPSKGVDSGPHS